MPKVPTVYDVAERAGVSTATVSFAFRRPEKVKESTREGVFTAARELGYVPSASARSLADGRTGALGLFSFDYMVDAPGLQPSSAQNEPLPPTGNEDYRLFPLYADEVQRGVELECRRRGYALMIGGQAGPTNDRLVIDIAGRVDGLIVFPGKVPRGALEGITRRIPVIVLSEPPADDNEGMAGYVTVDDAGGTRSLAEHLIQDHGYQDIQFIGSSALSDVHARFVGLCDALRAANLKVPAGPLEHGTDPRAVVADLLNRNAMPDAIMCSTDLNALDLIDALVDAGVSVPGQVAVTGFDGLVAGRIASPSLTTVLQPMDALGAAAVDMLIKKIENPKSKPGSRELAVRPVIRQSCGCPG